jgi:spore maturation protein CgeB
MIADEFTYQSFAPEFEVHRLTPGNWRETFERVQPALFFCESAWSGGTPPERPWAGQIYATMAWPEERRRHLLEILAHCRRRGIPTVFWNKEDPIHFPDRRNDFVRTAGLFDLVLTTAEECIALYQRDAGSEHVDVLPFAVQPRIFHPRSGGDAADSAVFAGTWYERYPQRTAALSRILDLVTSSGRGLVIYDRQFNSPEGYRFPARYDVYRRPAISYEETARAYRDHLFGITLNTITDSHTMFARRVFEMAACGQVILSNTAVGVEAFFGDSVIYADREPERYLALNGAEMLRMRREALAAALNNTYAHRAVTVLEHLGMRPAPLDQPVTLVTAIRTEEDYAAACRHRNRGGVGDILCLVSDNAEEGLLLSLSSRHEPGVAVELSRRVFSGEIRSRALIQTRSVLLGDVDRLPDETWIAKATPHLAYSDLPLIAGGTADVGVERVAASAGLYGSLMTAEMFDRFVCGGERLPALNALRG